MKITYGVKKNMRIRKPVIALGVFDGLHLGHRNILKAAVKKAKEIRGTSVVLTFFPHPQQKASLYSLEHRLRLIAELGIDLCIVVRFSRHFARLSAQKFIADILAARIRPDFVYVGENFRFGYRAAGDCRLLISSGRQYGFTVKVFKVIKSGRGSVSSTAIRRLIRNSKLSQAARLLGRPVSVLGTVKKGSALGRLLGFPTANINPHHEIIPPPGVYAVRVFLSRKKYNGACYIGRRPSLRLKAYPLVIEVHIFDFSKRIYGQTLEIQFVKLIRPDRKFPSLAALTLQIRKDILICRRILLS